MISGLISQYLSISSKLGLDDIMLGSSSQVKMVPFGYEHCSVGSSIINNSLHGQLPPKLT